MSCWTVSCKISVILTRLNDAASHHDCSVTCHVSRIQNHAHLPCYYLTGCQHRLWSTHGNRTRECCSTWVLLVDLQNAAHWQTPEELTLSGIHMCGQNYWGDASFLFIMAWMVSTGWELLALFLSVWIAVKHFCDLRRLGPSTGSTIGDSFRVLVKSHVLYFARWACNWECGYLLLLKFCAC
jgi:hypothetical protein